ncbi:DUF397 domain-containing protein [Streptomyces sp. MZ04]|uniref:DUF397 domain-containing protein n=1 Tax=Streptomyces sp. MZ04 TaxID=2559236 RepID=UPI00107EAA7D|nr:DUF397 domain-containing protein [Streptomyces sp. MZ04]TGB03050.1 DUF397 domain-containing protein [Streptomyces sp. MZ04]
MGTSQDLTNARWRKSTYSGNTGGDCIEIAPREGTVAVRDSKNPEGPAFTIAEGTFASFVEAAATGALG